MKKKIPIYLKPVVIILILSCLSYTLSLIIPGEVTKFISDSVTVEGSGQIIIWVVIFTFFIIAYPQILKSLPEEKHDKLDKEIPQMENSKINNAQFVMDYRKKTKVIDNMYADGPVRHMLHSYHLSLIPQNDIKFAPTSLQFWTNNSPDTYKVPIRLKDMGEPENGEYDIDVGEFFAHGEHEKSYAGFTHDIQDAEEIIWEFAYRSNSEPYKIVKYYKWGGDFEGYIEQEFAHESEADWIIEKWQEASKK